ncbi:MAG: DUF1501 domain-containing protein, partial [Planctomycetes bacterium]|nr:DUF1501 domain-containing protein [Planctomycetota bacterium]
MNPIEEHYLSLTRRRFFGRAATSIGAGLGALSLGSLLGGPSAFAAQDAPRPLGPHFAPKAKRVIYLHMEGGPSHLDLYDYKPELRRRFNQDLPDSIRKGQRLTTMTSGQTRFPVAPSMFRFQRAENRTGGVWLPEILPHTASVANEIAFIHSMETEAINHEPGITFFQTGNQQPG